MGFFSGRACEGEVENKKRPRAYSSYKMAAPGMPVYFSHIDARAYPCKGAINNSSASVSTGWRCRRSVWLLCFEVRIIFDGERAIFALASAARLLSAASV